MQQFHSKDTNDSPPLTLNNLHHLWKLISVFASFFFPELHSSRVKLCNTWRIWKFNCSRYNSQTNWNVVRLEHECAFNLISRMKLSYWWVSIQHTYKINNILVETVGGAVNVLRLIKSVRFFNLKKKTFKTTELYSNYLLIVKTSATEKILSVIFFIVIYLLNR